jgi:hypothetical protein
MFGQWVLYGLVDSADLGHNAWVLFGLVDSSDAC